VMARVRHKTTIQPTNMAMVSRTEITPMTMVRGTERRGPRAMGSCEGMGGRDQALWWATELRLHSSIACPRLSPMLAVDFYYDVVCPYAYLASTQIDALAHACGAQVTYCPMLLGGVFRAIGSSDR